MAQTNSSLQRWEPIVLSILRIVVGQLWDRLALVGLNQVGVRGFDLTVSVDVGAEVRARHGLVRLTFNLLLVRFIDHAIGIGVGREKAKRDVTMWQSISINVQRSQGHDLSWSRR